MTKKIMGVIGATNPRLTAERTKEAFHELARYMGFAGKVKPFVNAHQAGETYNQYRARREAENKQVKQMLKGELIYVAKFHPDVKGTPYVKAEFGPIGRRMGSGK
jgi:hypothetical protein